MELSATTVVEYHGNYCHKGQHTRCHRRFTARNNKIKTQIMSLGPYQGQLKTSARSKMKLHVTAIKTLIAECCHKENVPVAAGAAGAV